jgi:hypothetical protein
LFLRLCGLIWSTIRRERYGIGCKIAQANYYVLTTEVFIQSQDNPYRICGRQNGTLNLLVVTAVFAC